MVKSDGVQHVCEAVTDVISTVTGAVGLSGLLLKAMPTGAGWPIIACAGTLVGARSLQKYLAGKQDKDAQRAFVESVEAGIRERLQKAGCTDLASLAGDESVDVEPQLKLLATIANAAATEGDARQINSKPFAACSKNTPK